MLVVQLQWVDLRNAHIFWLQALLTEAAGIDPMIVSEQFGFPNDQARRCDGMHL